MKRYFVKGIIVDEESLLNCYRKELLVDESVWDQPYNEWRKQFCPVISREDSDRIYNAAVSFSEALGELHSAFEQAGVTEESFNENLTENYPFALSFDEVLFKAVDWVEDIKAVCGGLGVKN